MRWHWASADKCSCGMLDANALNSTCISMKLIYSMPTSTNRLSSCASTTDRSTKFVETSSRESMWLREVYLWMRRKSESVSPNRIIWRWDSIQSCLLETRTHYNWNPKRNWRSTSRSKPLRMIVPLTKLQCNCCWLNRSRMSCPYRNSKDSNKRSKRTSVSKSWCWLLYWWRRRV